MKLNSCNDGYDIMEKDGRYIEVDIISAENWPDGKNAYVMVKGSYKNYRTPIPKKCEPNIIWWNYRMRVDLKDENVSELILEVHQGNHSKLWCNLTLNLEVCKLGEWSIFTKKINKMNGDKSFQIDATLHIRLRLREAKNNRGTLPGEIVFPIEYDLEKDLEQCKQEYHKYAPIIKQDFLKTTEMQDNESIEISILQFNMLADALCTAYTRADNPKEFLGIDKECLRWSYRSVRLAELLLNLDADIICLEECDQYHFFARYLFPKYECIHQAKDKAPALKIMEQLQQERKDSLPRDFTLANDGIFIAYRKDKFKMIGNPIHINDKANKSKVVALAVRLQHQEDEDINFMLIGTHLKSDKTEAGEKIRQGQVQNLFQDLIPIEEHSPVILCCDLNANPTQNKNGYEPICYEELVNKFNFESVYVKGQQKEPEFTTFKKREHGIDKHTIDYIFTRNVPCQITHLLQITDHFDTTSELSLIPNWNYPSDHFAIGCKLQWSKKMIDTKTGIKVNTKSTCDNGLDSGINTKTKTKGKKNIEIKIETEREINPPPTRCGCTIM